MGWEKNKEKFYQGNHIAGLDGLRGIGVLGILLFHLFPNTWKGGYAGVMLFFVLSGYLLAFTSMRSRRTVGFSLGSYYKKRIQRIFPPLIATVFITLGFLKILAPGVLTGIRSEVLSIFLGYNNLWQIGQNASYFTRISNASPFTHLWFLAIEMQFYLIWPLVFFLYCHIREGKYKKAAGVVVLLPALLSLMSMFCNYVPGEDVTRVYYGTDTRIFSMFFGVCLGLRQAEKEQISRKRIGSYGEHSSGGFWKAVAEKIAAAAERLEKPLFVMAVAVLLAVYLLMDGEAEFTYRFGLLAVTLFFCGLLQLVSDPKNSLGEFLDATPLAWLGKRSYEIYLWQYPVIFLFQYYKLDRYWIFIPLMLILIAALSLWTRFILRWMREKITFGGRRMKYVKKSVVGLMTVVLMFAFVLGGCSLFTASDDDGEEQKQLESELEKNSKELEEQQKKEEQEKLQQQKEEEQKNQKTEAGFITAIGDSVMLGAAPALQETLPGCVVDAAESRQVVKAKAVVETLKGQGKLGGTVVLGLGTNGPFKTSVGQELLDTIGADKTVYWVNVYGAHLRWQDDSNATISELAQKNDNVRVIDWASQAASHPEWFYNDGIHLKPAGQKAYAQLVFESIAQD